jgi:hypothetical protein
MIPTRLAPVAFAFFVSIIMSAVISGVSTTTAIGFTSALPATWFQAWYSSWIVAFPILMVVAPTARRIVGRLTKPPV